MRFIILGAGAVGGTVGGRLAQHGHATLLIARGAHYEAIRDHGLRLQSPDETITLTVPVVDRPAAISWTSEDVLMLATKTQDTPAALDALAAAAPPHASDLLRAERRGERTDGQRAIRQRVRRLRVVPDGLPDAGFIQVWCAPKSGILHLGRYPNGSDALTDTVAAALAASSFYSESKPDIMRWKYRKLLSNLGNAVEALCGTAARGSGLAQRARREAIECFAAAGIGHVADDEEDAARLERT